MRRVENYAGSTEHSGTCIRARAACEDRAVILE
jgi:hypothetical protein